MRKPDFCICENKDADQLRGNREADQRLCFRYMDSSHLLWLSSLVCVGPGNEAHIIRALSRENLSLGFPMRLGSSACPATEAS